MTRAQLEHLIRAAAEIAAADDIVIIGSQAILGQFPDAPPSMRVSAEADLYPLHHPERADLNVEGVCGRCRRLGPYVAMAITLNAFSWRNPIAVHRAALV